MKQGSIGALVRGILPCVALLLFGGVPVPAAGEALLVRVAPEVASSIDWRAALLTRLSLDYDVEELTTTLDSPDGCRTEVPAGALPRLCLRFIDDRCATRPGAPAWTLLQDGDEDATNLSAIVAELVADGLLDHRQSPAGPWHKPRSASASSGDGICTFEWPRPDVPPRAGALTNLCSASATTPTEDVGQLTGPDPLQARSCNSGALRDAGAGVLVGVLDTGVALDHPDLAGRISSAPQLDVLSGRTSTAYDYVPRPDEGRNRGHGTHVAGIIAANQDDPTVSRGEGMRGVAPLAEILPVRMLDRNVEGNVIHAREAVCHAIEEGVDIINASWAFCGPTPAEERFLREAIELAADEQVLVVAAASPLGAEMAHPGYPAGYDLPNVISVASTFGGFKPEQGACALDGPVVIRFRGVQSTKSRAQLFQLDSPNRGDPPGPGFGYCLTQADGPCDVAAPGFGIFSTTYPVPRHCRLYDYVQPADNTIGFTLWEGPSFAVPYVVGAAATYLSRCRALGNGREPTASEVREAVFKASEQPPGPRAAFPNMHGFLDLAALDRCTCPGEASEISCAP